MTLLFTALAAAGVAVGDEEVVDVLAFAKAADVGADTPTELDELAGGLDGKLDRGRDELGGLVDAASARPSVPAGEGVLAACVDRPVITAGNKLAARVDNILPLAITDLDLEHRSVEASVTEERRFELVPVIEGELGLCGGDPDLRRNYFINARLVKVG